MSLADEMRTISQNAGNSPVDAAYACTIKEIKEAAEKGKREIVWDPHIPNYRDLGFDSMWPSERDKELLKEKLEREGFRIVKPFRVSGGVTQLTEYVQW